MRTERPAGDEPTGRQAADRPGPGDLDEMLAASHGEPGEVLHAVADHADAIFTWDYDKGARPGLNRLYEKAKTSQWNGETDLPWDTDVDPERVLTVMQGASKDAFGWMLERPDSPFRHFGPREWTAFGMETVNWRLSQFLHGEQGALLCTAKIVETVPWIDAKYYAATQVMDEARHVEVFARYLRDKLTGHYPINPHLGLLLDEIIADSRWDMTYLGMQVMVEGLALAAFGFMHHMTGEPLLKKLLRYVMSDEARHVAFGVLSLEEVYAGLTEPEIRERQEFAFEAAVRMRDRLLQQEVWERLGIDQRKMMALLLDAPQEQMVFTQMLFSKIVPNCKKLGLLDAGDGWLRARFEDIGVIQFEHWADTSEEYVQLDAVAADRRAARA